VDLSLRFGWEGCGAGEAIGIGTGGATGAVIGATNWMSRSTEIFVPVGQ